MRLTAKEMWSLLPLLRPHVEIEIVLHELPGSSEDDVATGDGRKRRWTTAEREYASNAQRERRRREKLATANEPEPIPEPMPEPEPAKAVQVKAFADGGTPDQQQQAALRTAVQQMRAAKRDGGV